MSFLEEFEQTLNEKCKQNEPPFCSGNCPFHLDVHDLAAKWKKGRWNAAYRTISNGVGFPEIVAAACDRPCERVCPRAETDLPVRLNLLERTTMSLASRKTPNAYPMPAKGKRVAIVGGGISGLGCALFLCNKKYDVTIWEASDHLGGGLRSRMDPEVFDRDVASQFRHEKYELVLNHPVKDLIELSGYDAVYVATGENIFGLQPNGTGACASTLKGVFFGGTMCGRTYMEALAEGIQASHAIERYLKTGLMNQPEERRGTDLCRDMVKIVPFPVPEVSGETGAFTEEEGIREAERCALCACDACMRECDLLRLYKKTPRRLYEEVYITIRPGTLVRDGTWATRLLSTCNQCGLCREACPEKIDIGRFMLEGHRAMHEKGTMPWPFHDYGLRELAFSNGEAAFLKFGKHCEERPEYLFFPGCQMGASDPRYVTESFAWLEEHYPESALWVHCCGAPAEWAGSEEIHGPVLQEIRRTWMELGEPKVVFGCATCRMEFERYLPEIPGVFLFELMAEDGGLSRTEGGANKGLSQTEGCSNGGLSRTEGGSNKGLSRTEEDSNEGLPRTEEDSNDGLPRTEEDTNGDIPTSGKTAGPVCIFDPCASRDYPSLQEAVRELVIRSGTSVEPGDHEGKLAQCCSYGGHIGAAAGNYAAEVVRQRLESRKAPVLTYCVNCRDAFASQGKDTRYLMDLLFGLNDGGRPAPTITERWENRRRLKREMTGEAPEEGAKVKLYIEEGLRRRLSEDMILESDMEQVIAYCEESGRKILDPETGHMIGHRKLQNMTYWAEYAPEQEGFRLFKGYAHRMCLEAEDETQVPGGCNG